MARRVLIVGAIAAAGCRGAPDHDGFVSISTLSPPAGSSTEEISSSTDASTSSGSTTSTGTSGDSTGPRLDLGAGPDLEPPQPAGCKGKIDFLFVISSGQYVEDLQAKLALAFPKFIETIKTRFADFDFHILVTDGADNSWGNPWCNEDCPNVSEAQCGTSYPCDQLDLVGPCETTWGAGTVFNAGYSTMNKPCGVVGGRRYLTREQPDLSGTFQCVARVGGNGSDLLGLAVMSAVSPELQGPGGCNEGFLRDDALLVVTFATATADEDSPGTPPEWAQAVIDAKHGDPDAIVAFGIGPPKAGQKCQKLDTVCQMVDTFPRSHWISGLGADYAPGFDAATNAVLTACGEFIPQ